MSIPYIDAVGEELRERVIHISSNSCEFCGNPWAQVKTDGVLVVEDDNVEINTLEALDHGF